jgi:hypothetical protein
MPALAPKTDLIQFEGGVLVCDMLLDAQAVHTLELTQHAIETGSVISDHAIHRPFTIDLTLVQTETPIETGDGFSVTTQDITVPGRTPGRQASELAVPAAPLQPNFNALLGSATARLFGAAQGALTVDGVKADTPLQQRSIKVTALTANSPKDRVNEFYDQLLALLEGVTPLVVAVKGYVWVDLVLTSVTRTDAPGEFGAARFAVSLQRVTTVTTQTVELPPVPEATRAKPRGSKPVYDTDFGPKFQPDQSPLLQNTLDVRYGAGRSGFE